MGDPAVEISVHAVAGVVMLSTSACPMPKSALLNRYGNVSASEDVQPFTDCYSVSIDREVALPEFVYAFYTTPVFNLERVILKHLAVRPSTDDEARQVSDGSIDAFAAWTVEERTEDQLLMRDFRGRTRSWFMVSPTGATGQPRTLLYFGSAVVPAKNRKTGKLEIGSGFRLLLGFHKLYSKILLYSARLRLARKLT